MLFHGAKAKTQTAMLLSVLIQRQSPFAETAVITTEAEAADAHTGANRSEHNTPANPDRKPLNEGGATGLYGRIDK